MEPYLPEKKQLGYTSYGATSTSKPLIFDPIGSGTDKKTLMIKAPLNLLIKARHRCVEGFYIRIEEGLPTEIWQEIWGYFNRRDKLKLASLSHAFVHIQQYIQLDICDKALANMNSDNYEYGYDYIHRTAIFVRSLYRYIKKISDICENTERQDIQECAQSILQNNENKALNIINQGESDIKSRRHYVKTEAYQDLKYLKKIFGNEDNTCTVLCMECQDESRETMGDYADTCSFGSYTKHGCSCLCCAKCGLRCCSSMLPRCYSSYMDQRECIKCTQCIFCCPCFYFNLCSKCVIQ